MPFRTLTRLWTILALSISLALICNCLEEEEREIYLRPRNFNPHPYETAGYDLGIPNNGNRGPVLFPETPDDSDGNSRNLNGNGRSNHPIDNHPYAPVSRKFSYKQRGRWQYQDNHINPQVYKGLSAHAAKILKKPSREEGHADNAYAKKDYKFSYVVQDAASGDDFSHTQAQNSEATNGEYRVKLPDGRTQIVSYTADKNGYKADVKYAEEPIKKNQIEAPIQDDYLYEDYEVNEPTPTVTTYQGDYYDATPLYEPPIDYEETGLQLFENIHNRRQKVQQQINGYNLYNGKVGKFISSTLAPYSFDSSKGFQQNVVVSTLAPELEQYSPVYINAPKFRLLQKHNRLHLRK